MSSSTEGAVVYYSEDQTMENPETITASVYVPIATSSGTVDPPSSPSSSSTTKDIDVASSRYKTSTTFVVRTSTISALNLPSKVTYKSSQFSSSSSFEMSQPVEHTATLSTTNSVSQPRVIHPSVETSPPTQSMLTATLYRNKVAIQWNLQ